MKNQTKVIVGAFVFLVALALSIYVIRGFNSKKNADGGSNPLTDEEKKIETLKKKKNDLLLKLNQKNNFKTIDQNFDEKIKEIKDKKGVEFWTEGKMIIFNAANENFKTGGGGLNKAITEFMRSNDGIVGENWRELDVSPENQNVAVSKFNFGYIIHINGLKASETKEMNLKISDVEDYIKNLCNKGFEHLKESKLGQNFLFCYVSNGIYANDGEDVDNKKFTKEEFKLRAEIGCLEAIDTLVWDKDKAVLNTK